ncbi:protein DpdF [Caballeronia sp. LjRoot34]|uniref:protein DpdF n=1 Tax=Caballeronia sp. LjRoot34 TaxID=3342325 RepID=UPI003ECE2F3C
MLNTPLINFNVGELQEFLSAWPVIDLPKSSVRDPLLDRICQVLSGAMTVLPSSLWHATFQPLIRHCLLRESARREQDFQLRVPRGEGWPSKVDWETHGVRALSIGDSAHYLLSAGAWSPDWLDSTEEGAFHDAFGDRVVRSQSECAADPFIRDATGFKNYSSPGQREAIRASFLMPRGETLIVNLPTGSGKSLVGQVGALINREEGYLTVFVVPTVALAIDQARAMEVYFQKADPLHKSWPLAWWSGLSKEGRAEIRQRLRNGTQRILFTSPEALSTSLISVITDVAKEGMLSYLVIDEAHLVTQWGDEFRPSFQALAGLRNNLLSKSPNGFRTLLLSATLTEDTVATLAQLFGPKDRVQMIAAVHLRPEPQYWVYKAASKKEKEERILEALRHAPRPFILYVTKREDVEMWNSTLRTKAGLGRIACFDGGTPDQERLEIISKWASNKLDGMIATSAFGVGIDKSDVRTIIHAAIPETLDRFYQEVGRGGRDGHPSVSLLVWTDGDWDLPSLMAQPKIVTEEMGFNRWKAMYQTRLSTDEEDLYNIDIDAVRDGLLGGNEHNAGWNMRTLILMARANMITLDLEPSVATESESEEEENSSVLAKFTKVRVRILDDGHHLSTVWENRVATSRDKTKNAALNNLRLMRRIVEQEDEVGQSLAELYRIRSPEWEAGVTHVCGGCSKDRFLSDLARRYLVPVPVPISQVDTHQMTAWKQRFPWIDPTFVYVFYDEASPQLSRTLVKLADWLVHECFVQEIFLDETLEIKSPLDWHRLYRRSETGVLLHRNIDEMDGEPYTPIARLTILGHDIEPTLFDQIQSLQRPYHFVLLPENFLDPSNTQRRLIDVTRYGIPLQSLLTSISQ